MVRISSGGRHPPLKCSVVISGQSETITGLVLGPVSKILLILTNSKASSTVGSTEKGACYYLKHLLVSLLNYGMANYIVVMPMKRKRPMS